MATKSAFVWDESYKAGADLSSKQYYCVEYTGVDTVNACNAASDRAIGILQNKPAANQGAQVRHLGISMAVSDGSGTAIAAGDTVGPNGSGVLVKKATADYSAIGIAMDASSANGTVIRVLMIPLNWFRTAAG
jgi:hypothetical protein